jgi:JAB1/Mov34/MPN/PAD-1 ubiquitin protease
MPPIKFTDQSPAIEIPVAPSHMIANAPEIQIKVAGEAHFKVLSFLKTSEFELGGLLLGRIWAHPDAPQRLAQVDIVEAVPSQQGTSSAYSLKMASEVWVQAQERLAQCNGRLADHEQKLRFVGWFHSHPHLGAFFSDTDIATQRAFFRQPYSVGWVIDPYTALAARHQAFFLGPDCKPIGPNSL